MAFNTEITWILEGDKLGSNPSDQPTLVPPKGVPNVPIYEVFENTVYNSDILTGYEGNTSSNLHNSLSNLQGGLNTQRYHLSQASHIDLTSVSQSSQNNSLDIIESSLNTQEGRVDTYVTDLSINNASLHAIEEETSVLTESLTENSSKITLLEAQFTPGDNPLWFAGSQVYSYPLSKMPSLASVPLFDFTCPEDSIPDSLIIFMRFYRVYNYPPGFQSSYEWVLGKIFLEATHPTLQKGWSINTGNAGLLPVFEPTVSGISGHIMYNGSAKAPGSLSGYLEVCGVHANGTPIEFIPKASE